MDPSPAPLPPPVRSPWGGRQTLGSWPGVVAHPRSPDWARPEREEGTPSPRLTTLRPALRVWACRHSRSQSLHPLRHLARHWDLRRGRRRLAHHQARRLRRRRRPPLRQPRANATPSEVVSIPSPSTSLTQHRVWWCTPTQQHRGKRQFDEEVEGKGEETSINETLSWN